MHSSLAAAARRFKAGTACVRLILFFLLLTLLLAPTLRVSANESKPALMLAKVYHPGLDLQDYWVSEKYDGMRGYWDGKQLLTRGGEPVFAPTWFTAGWPEVPMDGELWAGRGQFQQTVATVRKKTPDDDAWRSIRFMVFDLPAHGGTFTERIPALNAHVQKIDQPWLQAVPQWKVASHQALGKLLTLNVKAKGEGLMLHRGASLYRGGRTDDLLKVKTHEDAEAIVVGHTAGRGKYAGALGALLVEIPALPGQQPLRFRIGTGLSDADRRSPPPIGATVTYRFQGFNDSGIPRFASFLRIRSDAQASKPN
ncbi:MAG: DNA ligase-1 [Polaromonas sp.]|jgi:DNA ligase-1